MTADVLEFRKPGDRREACPSACPCCLRGCGLINEHPGAHSVLLSQITTPERGHPAFVEGEHPWLVQTIHAWKWAEPAGGGGGERASGTA